MPSAVVATSTFNSLASRRSSSRSRSSAGVAPEYARGVDVVGPQPIGDHLGVAHGEAVDDARPGHRRDVLHEPSQSLGLAGQLQHAERQAVAPEGSPERGEGGAELFRDVLHDPVVGGRRATEYRHDARPERGHEATDPPVVRPEVVAPVGDAVHLVDHDQPGPFAEDRHDGRRELGVGEPFG